MKRGPKRLRQSRGNLSDPGRRGRGAGECQVGWGGGVTL